MKDQLKIAYAYDKKVRIYVANTTNLVSYAQKIHGLWPTSSAALGRVLTVGAMMGCMHKNDEKITIRINGNGPIGEILVEANALGEVRGLVSNAEVFLQYASGKLNVGAAVGTDGYLHVTKDLQLKDLFTSSSLLQTGEIAEDFTYYFATSEQIASSVGLGVNVDVDNSILSAGGFIVQVMPECDNETIDILENIILKMEPISKLLAQNATLEDILSVLSNNKYQILEIKNLVYKCPCSKEKFSKSLKTIGLDELKQIYQEDQKCDITCHFCRKEYHFQKEDLKDMINSLENKYEI